MKKIAIILLILTVSCKSGLEKKYNKSSKEKDLIEISEQISLEDLKLLADYISKLEHSQQPIDNETYKGLLYHATFEEKERLSIIEEEKEEEKRKEKQEEEERILKLEATKKTEILCAHKWRMKEYSFVLESSEELSGIKMTDEVFKSEDKGWTKYADDGTFKTDNGRKGTWEFVAVNKIRETVEPSPHFGLSKKEVYSLYIKVLDKNTFKYIRVEHSSTLGAKVKISEVMKAI